MQYFAGRQWRAFTDLSAPRQLSEIRWRSYQPVYPCPDDLQWLWNSFLPYAVAAGVRPENLPRVTCSVFGLDEAAAAVVFDRQLWRGLRVTRRWIVEQDLKVCSCHRLTALSWECPGFRSRSRLWKLKNQVTIYQGWVLVKLLAYFL